MKRILLAVICLALATGPAVAQASKTQWKRVEGRSIADLIKAGYQMQGAGPGLAGIHWIYLQKGASLFRCDAELTAGIVSCLELVAPHDRK